MEFDIIHVRARLVISSKHANGSGMVLHGDGVFNYFV